MAAYTSSISAFKLAGVVVPAVGTMALSSSRPPTDVTPIGVLNTYILTGILTNVATLDVFYNKTDHANLTAELLAPAGIEVELYFDNSGTFDVFSGNATIVNMDIVSVSADVVRGSYTLQFYGPVSMNGVGSSYIEGNETPLGG
jgi:hypothetical protein